MDDDRDDGLKRRVHERYVRTPPASPDLRERITRALDRQDAAARRPGSWTWWWWPGTLRLAPAAALAAACLLLAAGMWLGSLGLPGPRRAAPQRAAAHREGVRAELAGTAGQARRHEVAFMLTAAGVRGVSLVGEFNGWDPHATPLVRVGRDGPWVTTVPLPPGRHLYAFVVDGARWVADPSAPLAPDDGFGAPSSVVVVGHEGPI